MHQVADKSNLVFAEIFNALGALDEKIASSKSLYSSTKLSDARRQIVELESLLQKEKAEVEVCHLDSFECNHTSRVSKLPVDVQDPGRFGLISYSNYV